MQAPYRPVWIEYDQDLDTLYLYPGDERRPGVAAYLADGVYALFEPETLTVVGFQIEDFQSAFLAHYARVTQLWQQRPRPWENLGALLLDVLRCYVPTSLPIWERMSYQSASVAG